MVIVVIEIEPTEKDEDMNLKMKLLVELFQKNIFQQLMKVFREALNNGILGRISKLLILKLQLYDGSYHEVDSSEMAFKIAGSMAFKDAMSKSESSTS